MSLLLASILLAAPALAEDETVVPTLQEEVAPGGETSRATTRAAVESRWGPRRGPFPAPGLEASLDGIALDLATGALEEKKAERKVARLSRDDLLGGEWSMGVYQVFVGETPDVGGLEIAGKARYLAVGQGTGDHTILLVVAAEDAQ